MRHLLSRKRQTANNVVVVVEIRKKHTANVFSSSLVITLEKNS